MLNRPAVISHNDEPAPTAKPARASGAAAPRGTSTSVGDLIRDARLLIHYAARHGTKLQRPHLDAVLKAEEAFERGQLSKDAEMQLLESFREINRAMFPVTLESIRATNRGGFSGPKWHVRSYALVALFSLFCVLSVQVYWLVGAQLAKDVDSNLNDYDIALKAILVEEESLDVRAISNDKIEQLYIDMRSLNAQLITDGQSLHKWNLIWAALVPFVPPFATPEYDRLSLTAKSRVDNASAKLVLQSMSAYLLPLLYGLLGASVYILRGLSREVTAVTFTDESAIRYALRLTLGPLAGVAIGLLIVAPNGSPDSAPPVLQALSLPALAFAAGYGIEILFSLLDRIILTVTGDPAAGATRAERQ